MIDTQQAQFEKKVLTILEKLKNTLNVHKSKLIEIVYESRTKIRDIEIELHILGKVNVQSISEKSDKIKALYKEIEKISEEISEL